jgi:hypothetical protein
MGFAFVSFPIAFSIGHRKQLKQNVPAGRL